MEDPLTFETQTLGSQRKNPPFRYDHTILRQLLERLEARSDVPLMQLTAFGTMLVPRIAYVRVMAKIERQGFLNREPCVVIQASMLTINPNASM